ncbi:hypothetical protein K438DRAFT_1934813 [Mycena galopus ATCC 62051]|nr:hypothetical protein K438DRAFT_1934813 [Mycena galopus ATCC 62051]
MSAGPQQRQRYHQEALLEHVNALCFAPSFPRTIVTALLMHEKFRSEDSKISHLLPQNRVALCVSITSSSPGMCSQLYVKVTDLTSYNMEYWSIRHAVPVHSRPSVVWCGMSCCSGEDGGAVERIEGRDGRRHIVAVVGGYDMCFHLPYSQISAQICRLSARQITPHMLLSPKGY